MSEDKTVIKPNTDKYTSARSASGSKTLHSGDEVANALVGATTDEVKTIATSMGVEDVNKYDKLNAGQIRMNLGNRIRGLVAKMEKEKGGSGHAALKKASSGIRKIVDKRMAEEAKAKEAKAKAAAKAKADKAKAAAKKKAA